MERTNLNTLITLAIVLLLAFTITPDSGSAFPYHVEGYLKDADGLSIPHATLEVTGFVYNISSESFEEVTMSFPDESDNFGYFDIAFGVDEPGGFTNGETITIKATYNSKTLFSSLTLENLRTWKNLTADVDSDQDGLPDSWETEHFGDLTQSGSDDFDEDGYTNQEEHLAGTDPTDPQNPPPNGDGNILDFLLSPLGIAIIIIVVFMVIVAIYRYKTSAKEEEESKEEAKLKVGRRRQ